VDPVSGDLDLAYHQGLSPEFVEREAHYEAGDLNAYLVMAGKPLYARLEELPGLMDKEGLKEGLRSVAIIPVIHQGQVIACINVASHRYEEVPATARAALETLAGQVGSASARVQAAAALRRAKEDLEIRVAERTAQLQQANKLLEAEVRVRRDMERSLRSSEAKYRTIFNGVNDGIGVVDPATGKFLEVNRRWMEMTGYTAKGARGLSIGALCLSGDEYTPDDACHRVQAAARKGPQLFEWLAQTKDGRPHWVEVNLKRAVINDQDRLLTVVRDISERKRAEEALKESERELRQLTSQLLRVQEKERRRVARELHDELGQALTVLKINLVALEDQMGPEQQDLKANCEHMLSYIDTVIENVRRLSWDLSPSSLEDLGLSAALGYLVDETCRTHNLQAVVAMDEIDHLFTPEIQINIYRMFQESLTNVVKHAGAGRVTVNVSRTDGKVSFMIRDNGRGFNVGRVMDGKAAKRGLGLTAMNERAHMVRGSLQILSRPGRGTTVAFTIPANDRGN